MGRLPSGYGSWFTRGIPPRGDPRHVRLGSIPAVRRARGWFPVKVAGSSMLPTLRPGDLMSLPIVHVVHIPERVDGIYLFSDRQDADRFAGAAGASAPTPMPLIPSRHSTVQELIDQESSE